MLQVNDQVAPTYFDQAAPRPVSPLLLLNIFGEHVLERPFRTILHPIFVLSTVVLIIMVAVRAAPIVVLVPLAIVIGMLLGEFVRVGRYAWDDVRLLRDGLKLRAHILKLRPNHTLSGEIRGALLDCAIAVAPRRTYVGSIWLADGNEALRLLKQGRLQVVCLPTTPGTWRVIEPMNSQVRYDRVGPTVTIPTDI